jgi:hypothetical protein
MRFRKGRLFFVTAVDGLSERISFRLQRFPALGPLGGGVRALDCPLVRFKIRVFIRQTAGPG